MKYGSENDRIAGSEKRELSLSKVSHPKFWGVLASIRVKS